MAKVEKPQPKVLGTVCNGKYRVIEYTAGIPLLEIGRTVLGARKIKDVRSEPKACDEFLAKYDVDKPKNVVPQASVEAAKQIEELRKSKSELEARLLALSQASAQATVPSRVDPLQKAA